MSALGAFVGGFADYGAKQIGLDEDAKRETKRQEDLARLASKIKREEMDFEQRNAVVERVFNPANNTVQPLNALGQPVGPATAAQQGQIDAYKKQAEKDEVALGYTKNLSDGAKNQASMSALQVENYDADRALRNRATEASIAASGRAGQGASSAAENAESQRKRAEETQKINKAAPQIARVESDIRAMFPDTKRGNRVIPNPYAGAIIMEFNNILADPSFDYSPERINSARQHIMKMAQIRLKKNRAAPEGKP